MHTRRLKQTTLVQRTFSKPRFSPLRSAVVFSALFLVLSTSVTGIFTYTRGRAYAATNSTLNFQGRLLSNTGGLVADGSYNIQFKLYDGGTAGGPVGSGAANAGTNSWTETHLVSATQGITVKNGFFSVNLGDTVAGGTVFPTTINWDQEQWLGMTVRGTTSCAFGACSPADIEMAPRFKLTSVPYAFRAGKVLDAAGTYAFTADDLIQKAPSVIQSLSSALAAVRLNQTSTGGFLQLQNSGSDVFTIDKLGSTVQSGNLNVNGNAVLGDASSDRLAVNAQLLGANALVFQGATDDPFTTTFQITDPTSNNTIIFPNASGTVQLAPVTGSYIQQVPTGVINTISPTAAGVTGLTVNGTTNAISAAAAVFNQANNLAAIPGDTVQINSTNTSGTQANGLLINRNGAGGTTTNLLNLSNTAGTATNGLAFTGTFSANLINAPNFSVANSGAITAPSLTSSGALVISSAASSGLTLDSGNNILSIAASDSTIQRTAAGSYTFDLNDVANTTLVLTNSGVGIADLNLAEGGLLTAGTSRLTNGGVLQNITGLTVSSGGASISGTATFVNNIAANGNVTLGDAITDRVTFTSQILSANALVFQGATDDAFTTTFQITDPTANNVITVPNTSGTLALIGPAAAQIDSTTNSSLFINKTGASGNILTLQKSGTAVFTIANGGATGITTTSATALSIKDTTSLDYFTVDTSGGIVRIGSATADATGTVLVLDTKTTAGDPSGVNGAQYYNSFTQSFRCYRGVNATAADGVWEDCGKNTIDHGWRVEDDFLSGNTAALSIGSLGWNLQAITGGVTASYNNAGVIAPTADRPGILRLRTPGQINRGSTMSLSGSSQSPVPIGPGTIIRTSVAAFKNAAAQAPVIRIGQHAETTTTTASNAGVWWEANTAVNANWQYCYGSGAAAVCAASSVAVGDNAWTKLEIRVVSSTAIDFLINGTKISVSAITLDTITQTSPALTCYAGSAVAQDCFIDYFQISGGSGNAR